MTNLITVSDKYNPLEIVLSEESLLEFRKKLNRVNAEYYGADRIKKIVCHPNNLRWIMEWANNNCGIPSEIPTFSIRGIDVETYAELPEYIERPSGAQKYFRTEVCRDNDFCELVHDLGNPPEWAIYFGLVELGDEIIKERLFYGLTSQSVFNFNDMYSYSNIISEYYWRE